MAASKMPKFKTYQKQKDPEFGIFAHFADLVWFCYCTCARDSMNRISPCLNTELEN